MRGPRDLTRVGASMVRDIYRQTLMSANSLCLLALAPGTREKSVQSVWLSRNCRRRWTMRGSSSPRSIAMRGLPISCLALALAACGGDGGGGLTNYSIGGTVTGLSGTGLVLQSGGGDNLAISGNGPFMFSSELGTGQPYAVSVLTPITAPVPGSPFAEAPIRSPSACPNSGS